MRLAPLLLCAACAHPQALDLSVPSNASIEEVQTTEGAVADNKCAIDGSGELSNAPHVELGDFEVYAQKGDWEPALIVNDTDAVRIKWSSFPQVATTIAGAADPLTRAHVDLGGQMLVRMPGYASLVGRAFQLRKRADALQDHVWIRAGRDVEVVGMDGEDVVIEAATGLTQPARLRARVSCDTLAYQPDALPQTSADAPATGGTPVYLASDGLHLMDAPNASLGMRLVPDSELQMARLEIRSGHARIAGEVDGVAFDGWVPEEDITINPPHSYHGHSVGGSGRCGSGGTRTYGRVNKDTPLWVGKRKIDGAWVERGAIVIVWDHSGPMTSFVFESGAMRAPNSKEFWIETNAITIEGDR